MTVQADVARGDHVQAMVARTVAERGRLDILVRQGAPVLEQVGHEVLGALFHRVFAVIIKQLKPGAAGYLEIGNIELPAVHSLELLEAKDAPVEIHRAVKIYSVYRDVFDPLDVQCGFSRFTELPAC